MSFKITITETREVVKKCGGNWKTVDTEEVSRDGVFAQDGGPKTRIKDVYGYTPEIEKTVTEERDVLIQEVDTLDLNTVICAINGLNHGTD